MTERVQRGWKEIIFKDIARPDAGTASSIQRSLIKEGVPAELEIMDNCFGVMVHPAKGVDTRADDYEVPEVLHSTIEIVRDHIDGVLVIINYHEGFPYGKCFILQILWKDLDVDDLMSLRLAFFPDAPRESAIFMERERAKLQAKYGLTDKQLDEIMATLEEEFAPTFEVDIDDSRGMLPASYKIVNPGAKYMDFDARGMIKAAQEMRTHPLRDRENSRASIVPGSLSSCK